jgi:hypothetical protein
MQSSQHASFDQQFPEAVLPCTSPPHPCQHSHTHTRRTSHTSNTRHPLILVSNYTHVTQVTLVTPSSLSAITHTSHKSHSSPPHPCQQFHTRYTCHTRHPLILFSICTQSSVARVEPAGYVLSNQGSLRPYIFILQPLSVFTRKVVLHTLSLQATCSPIKALSGFTFLTFYPAGFVFQGRTHFKRPSASCTPRQMTPSFVCPLPVLTPSFVYLLPVCRLRTLQARLTQTWIWRLCSAVASGILTPPTIACFIGMLVASVKPLQVTACLID